MLSLHYFSIVRTIKINILLQQSTKLIHLMGVEVFTVVCPFFVALRDVRLSNVIGPYKCFPEESCLHLHVR
jgi:hypothetical protein